MSTAARSPIAALTQVDRAAAVLSRDNVDLGNERAVMRAGAGRHQRLRRRCRAGQAEHLMAGADELLDDGLSDEAGGPGDEDAHATIPCVPRKLRAAAGSLAARAAPAPP